MEAGVDSQVEEAAEEVVASVALVAEASVAEAQVVAGN